MGCAAAGRRRGFARFCDEAGAPVRGRALPLNLLNLLQNLKS
jgi:hypothetical protein